MTVIVYEKGLERWIKNFCLEDSQITEGIAHSCTMGGERGSEWIVSQAVKEILEICTFRLDSINVALQ